MLFIYLAVFMGALVAGVYSMIHGAAKRKAQGAFGLAITASAIVIGFSLVGVDPHDDVASIAVTTLKIILALTPFLGAFIAASAMATARVDRLSKLI